MNVSNAKNDILNQVDDQFTHSLTAHRAKQSGPEPEDDHVSGQSKTNIVAEPTALKDPSRFKLKLSG